MLLENVSSYGWTSHWSQKYICLPGVKEAMTKITWQIAWKSFYTKSCKLPFPNFEETIRECSFFIPGVGTDENELGKPFFEGLECVYSKWGHLEHTNQLHCRTKIEKINKRRINIYDWLICGHVTSDRCNVCRRATSENLLPVPTGYVRK